LTSAVREGARTLALGGTPAATTTATRTAAPGLTPANILVTPTACPANATPSDNASVLATYAFTYSIPFFRSGTWSLTAKGVMRCGG
jgi:hypothetical protein